MTTATIVRVKLGDSDRLPLKDCRGMRRKQSLQRFARGLLVAPAHCDDDHAGDNGRSSDQTLQRRPFPK